MTPLPDEAPYGFPEATADKGLKPGALGLMSSVVIGMASTAPAFSLAASLGFVVMAVGGSPDATPVGVKAPAIMMLAFVPMFLIAIAYQQLNKAEPDCGTTFTWASRAFGPRAGWMGGWGIIAADVVCMASLASIAGSYSFQLVGAHDLADSTIASMVAGVIWIVLMAYITYRGIEVSARLQYGLLGIEVIVLIVFSVIALFKVYSGTAPEGSLTPSLDWLSPAGLSLDTIVAGVLIAVFIYWGWDTAVSVNEETTDPGRTPGRAAVISTVLLLLTYATVSVAAVAFGGVGDGESGLGNPDNADDVFAALGTSVFGESFLGRAMEILLILSVLSSASASTQTTILPTARTSLAMGAYQALPASFARIHPKYLTPSVSTWWMAGVSVVFYAGMTFISDNVLQDAIASIGLLIAFYYGLTGFAAVWFYRHQLLRTWSNFLLQGVLPLAGGVMLLGAFLIAAKDYAGSDYGNTTLWGVGGVFVIGVGSLILGVILMVIWNAIAPAFFRGETLGKRHAGDLVLEAPMDDETVRLPDSGLPDLVIAPDLSNLPEGEVALDLRTDTGVEDAAGLRDLRTRHDDQGPAN